MNFTNQRSPFTLPSSFTKAHSVTGWGRLSIFFPSDWILLYGHPNDDPTWLVFTAITNNNQTNLVKISFGVAIQESRFKRLQSPMWLYHRFYLLCSIKSFNKWEDGEGISKNKLSENVRSKCLKLVLQRFKNKNFRI